jgi:hypothetical protein
MAYKTTLDSPTLTPADAVLALASMSTRSEELAAS